MTNRRLSWDFCWTHLPVATHAVQEVLGGWVTNFPKIYEFSQLVFMARFTPRIGQGRHARRTRVKVAWKIEQNVARLWSRSQIRSRRLKWPPSSRCHLHMLLPKGPPHAATAEEGTPSLDPSSRDLRIWQWNLRHFQHFTPPSVKRRSRARQDYAHGLHLLQGPRCTARKI